MLQTRKLSKLGSQLPASQEKGKCEIIAQHHGQWHVQFPILQPSPPPWVTHSPTERKTTPEGQKRAMSLITEELKAKAEVYHGDDICQEKSKFLLQEVGLPRGLLPLKDIIECGYVEDTGFVWLKQKKKIEHTFEKIGKLVSYGPEITAYVEKFKIRKLTGVKAKELLVWIVLNEITVDDPPTGKLTCKGPAGLFRTYPTSAFELKEEEEEEEKKKKKKMEAVLVPPLDKASPVASNK